MTAVSGKTQPDAPTPSSLLLPRRIRDEIYSYVIALSNSPQTMNEAKKPPGLLAMVAINKQIYGEFLEYFFQSRPSPVTARVAWNQTIEAIDTSRSVPARLRPLVKHLQIDFQHLDSAPESDLLGLDIMATDFSGVSAEGRDADSTDTRWDRRHRLLVPMFHYASRHLELFPNLKEVSVHFCTDVRKLGRPYELPDWLGCPLQSNMAVRRIGFSTGLDRNGGIAMVEYERNVTPEGVLTDGFEEVEGGLDVGFNEVTLVD